MKTPLLRWTVMRRPALAAALCVSAALLAPSTSSAETVTIGQIAPAGTANFCLACTFLQKQTDAASPSYTVPPGNWTVTSWSIMSGTTTSGEDRLRIFRPEGAVNRLVAETIDEGVIFDAAGAERSFTTSLPVQGGDFLGLRTGNPSGDTSPAYTTASVNDVVWNVVGDPVVGQTVGPGGDFPTFGTPAMNRLNVAVTLVRVVPTPADPPPETTITGGPGKKVADGKAKFRFTSSDANSTFICKRDRKPFRPCASPQRYPVTPGKHKFQVQAVDPAGNVDATPAKKKFSVPD